MRILLPPSETKRDGGDPAPLDMARLSYPSLTPQRRSAVRSLTLLSRNLSTMSAALRLGPNQRRELMRNRTVTRSPTMPALERYTGVLYDAVGVESLDRDSRRFADRVVVIHSALFGLLGAADPIPAYRVSHDSRLPGVRLGSLWREPIGDVLQDLDELVLDLRSDVYAALGPMRQGPDHRLRVRVVTVRPDGTVRALSHLNKAGKGALTRAIVSSGTDHPNAASLLDWAADAGIDLSRAPDGMLELAVDDPAPSHR